MTVPLSRELKRRFHRRSLPVRKGDTVRILGGSYVGREERVAKVNRRSLSVTLDNVTSKTGESKQTPLPIRTGHLVIVRLNLSDPARRNLLRVTEAELTPEERGETPEPTPAPATPSAEPPGETPTTATSSPAESEPEEGLDNLDEEASGEEEEEEEEEEAGDEPEEGAPKSQGRKRS